MHAVGRALAVGQCTTRRQHAGMHHHSPPHTHTLPPSILARLSVVLTTGDPPLQMREMTSPSRSKLLSSMQATRMKLTQRVGGGAGVSGRGLVPASPARGGGSRRSRGGAAQAAKGAANRVQLGDSDLNVSGALCAAAWLVLLGGGGTLLLLQKSTAVCGPSVQACKRTPAARPRQAKCFCVRHCAPAQHQAPCAHTR